MGCTPSTQLHDDDYSVGDSSSDEDTAGSTARSPRSSQRDVRHWRKVDLECRALSRPLGPPDLDEKETTRPPPGQPVSESDEETTRPGARRVSFRENLEDVVQIPPLSEISRSLRLDVYWSGQEFDNLHRQRQRLSVEVARQVLAAAKKGEQATLSTEFGGECLRGLGLVDERALGTIAQRQMRIRDRARRVVAAQLDATRSAQDVANLAERLARQDMAAAAAIANRDHQVAIGETPSPPPTPTTPLKLAAPPKNGAKPKSPAHAARRASGIEREATLDDSALRRPPMIRVDSLTSVRTDT